jgi:sensor histidine kinase YesM
MHGILPLEEGGCVDIEVKADGEQYVVEIRDNGIGMKAALLHADKNKQSLAMKLNSERLAMLRELTGQAFEITAEDVSVANKGDRGTVITVKIPISIKLEPLNF